MLSTLQPDVETLLINRARGAEQYFLVPIDACYRLVGLMRSSWRGLSGGQAVWTEIERFFETLRRRSQAVKQETFSSAHADQSAATRQKETRDGDHRQFESRKAANHAF